MSVDQRPRWIELARKQFPSDVARALAHLRDESHRYGDHRVVSVVVVERVLCFFAEVDENNDTPYDRWDWSQ